MSRSLSGTALLSLVILISGAALTPPSTAASDSPLQLAELAWDRGDYPAALTGFLQLLDSPQADAVVEAIALRTGELYQTTEITPDGALPRFSPDGRYITYESGAAAQRITHLVATADPGKPIAELRGWGASFSPDAATLAYIKTPDSPEVLAAQTALDEAPAADRVQKLAALTQLLNANGRVTVRDLATGRETSLDTANVSKASLLAATGGTVLFAGAADGAGPAQIHAGSGSRPAAALTSDQTDKIPIGVNSTGTALLFTARLPGAGRGGRGAGGTGTAAGSGRGAGGGTTAPTEFGVMALPDGKLTMVAGSAPSFSRDGRTLVFVRRTAEENAIMAAPTEDPAAATVVRKGPERVEAPAASPDGSRVAFQMMLREDWEIFTASRDGSGETRLTRDAQHDVLPQFVTSDRLVSAVGEARHRRSFLTDLATKTRTRLFHNNTLRTIAPEYAWEPSADGTKMLIAAERDGDTVSARRGVYLVDLTRKVSRQEVRARVAANLAGEEALRAKGRRLFTPIADAVKAAVAEVSTSRIYAYEKALFDFDSKHITRPGNKLASAYLFDAYQSFGYAPEFQWFERANALGGQTANVIATLKGTVNPELVYVVSSHYDSAAAGPGADDDSTGTAALLETARVLAGRPQPATIVFASFTGEEAGLLGSREFVRRAVADKIAVVGALNNDMVGWANDHRLDSTIRCSNAGIRDVQHAAALQFTNLITYDALYYKSTDAVAYYDAFGDIVGGIGSYPVLSSPHYHQPHDVLETINHQLVTEVAKTTAATLMLLASSPSRLTGLQATMIQGAKAAVSWTPSAESGVGTYLVAYGPPDQPESRQIRVNTPAATLHNVSVGTVVSVKAINAKGLEGWDWARTTIVK
ncbi:MAG TPA: M28 family peptidase [Vicinamibacterales bacterium]|nr:M28 family peptidase [Vicinamibacterales bacterium]